MALSVSMSMSMSMELSLRALLPSALMPCSSSWGRGGEEWTPRIRARC